MVGEISINLLLLFSQKLLMENLPYTRHSEVLGGLKETRKSPFLRCTIGIGNRSSV